MKNQQVWNNPNLSLIHEDNERKNFLKEHTECPLCEGELSIFTECIDMFRIKEEARCTQCMALLRQQSHQLH